MTPAVSSNMSIHHDYMETVLAVHLSPFTNQGTSEDGKNLLEELNITFSAPLTFDSISVFTVRSYSESTPRGSR